MVEVKIKAKEMPENTAGLHFSVLRALFGIGIIPIKVGED